MTNSLKVKDNSYTASKPDSTTVQQSLEMITPSLLGALTGFLFKYSNSLTSLIGDGT